VRRIVGYKTNQVNTFYGRVWFSVNWGIQLFDVTDDILSRFDMDYEYWFHWRINETGRWL